MGDTGAGGWLHAVIPRLSVTEGPNCCFYGVSNLYKLVGDCLIYGWNLTQFVPDTKQTQHQPDILTITIPSVEARLEKQKQILDLITLGNLKKSYLRKN